MNHIQANNRRLIYDSLLFRGVPVKAHPPIQIVHVVANFWGLPSEQNRKSLEDAFFKKYFPEDEQAKHNESKEKIYKIDGCLLQWNQHQMFSTYTFYCTKCGADVCRSTSIPSAVEALVKNVPGDTVDVVNLGMISAPRFDFDKVKESDFSLYLDKVISCIALQAEEHNEQVNETMESKSGLANYHMRKAAQFRKEGSNLAVLKMQYEVANNVEDPLRKQIAIKEVKAEARQIVKNLKGLLYKIKAKDVLGLPRESESKLFGNYAMAEATIWTPFTIETGSAPSYFLIYEKSLNENQLKRIVRLVLDAWTYTILALHLAIKVKEGLEKINAAARDLNGLMGEIQGQTRVVEAESHLGRLIANAEKFETYSADIGDILSAVPAYAEIVQRKLKQLEIERIPGTQNIESFILDRLMPEARLCENVDRRLKGLAQQNARATSLVRIKVDLTIQQQNNGFLESLGKNSRTQIRLKQVVEMVSVIPLTYYAKHLVHDAWPVNLKDFETIIIFIFISGVVYAMHKIVR